MLLVNALKLHAMQQRMQKQGIRRLLVISGESTWCQQQAKWLLMTLPGDWSWIGLYPPSDLLGFIHSTAARQLLGQERLHAVFDATQGLNVEALAILAGTLCAGSWLLLLTPPWREWHRITDKDSLRWNDNSQQISTPHFIQHLQHQLATDSEVSRLEQGEALVLRPLGGKYNNWQKPDGYPSTEQRAILRQLLKSRSGIWVLTATRGCGKSTLGGMLAARSLQNCWITGPSQAATKITTEWAQGHAKFWSPDTLLAACQRHDISQVGWLLVDEAAAIPTPILQKLVSYFPRVLLSTTVQGYEGSGRSFLLKFCSWLPEFHSLRLHKPIRWAQNDSLERVINNALLFNEPPELPLRKQEINIRQIAQQELCADPKLLRCFYALLSSAHYRTSLLDLRRLMDAPGMHFSLAQIVREVVGVLWLVNEGGLSAKLAHLVWAGQRRPRGHLVAQLLAVQCGQWWAPMLYSQRITRIAVLPALQRRGIARRLITKQCQHVQGLDFFSVSFGYTEELWAFWQSCGFELVHIGSKLNNRSGCYTVIAILPLSKKGKALQIAAHQRLARDWKWLQQRINVQLELRFNGNDSELSQEDWRELSGFAFAHRSVAASLGALNRLLCLSVLPLPALRLYLQKQKTPAQIIIKLSLSSKKNLLHHWRNEVTQALMQLNTQYYHQWRIWTNHYTESSINQQKI